MKVLVTGMNGQLATDVSKELIKREFTCFTTSRQEMNIENYDEVSKVINKVNPDVIIHCAAYTKVDIAEESKEECYNANVTGTENIVRACKQHDITLVFISTDYVFDGSGTRPWKESDLKNPVNFYGKSKSEAEDIIINSLQKYFILRISWAFGLSGNNFVKTMVRLGKTQKQIKVVNDQVGSPTYTKDVADLLVNMIGTNKYGIYHVTNEGYCSWYEFTKEICSILNYEVELIPVTTIEYGSKAKRPLNSRLDKQLLVDNGFYRLPEWKDALRRYIDELVENENKE